MKTRYPSTALIEAFLITLAAGLLAAFLYRYGGQVLGTDTLLYLDTAARGLEDPFILNRYTHVFLLAICSRIAGGALPGIRLYSALAGGLAIPLVYISGRSMGPAPSWLRGAAALGLFLGITRAFDHLVAPLVDTSAMLMLLTMIACYLYWVRRKGPAPGLLVLFGVLLFLSLRTKETLLVGSILVFGLLLEIKADRTVRMRWRRLAAVAGGMVVGGLTMIALNAWILSTPLFGFRPSDVGQYLQIWSETIASAPRLGTSFQDLVLGEFGIPFALFVIAGVKTGVNQAWRLKLVWLLPLALLFIVIPFSTRQAWGIVPRGYLPGAAALAILGAQAAPSRFPALSGFGRRQIPTIVAIGATLLLLVVGLVGPARESSTGTFLTAFYHPLVFALLIAAYIALDPDSERRGPTLVLLAAVLAVPVMANFVSTIRLPQNARYNTRFEPITVFGEQFQASSDFRMFVSSSTLPDLAISDNRDELSLLVNVGLGLETEREDYRIGEANSTLLEELRSAAYSHVLLTEEDWRSLQGLADTEQLALEEYRIHGGGSGRFVLLERK